MLVKSEGAIKNGFFRDTGNIGHTRHMTNKLKRKPSIMDTPETLATLSTQNKRQKKELVKTKGAIKNGHSRDTGNIEHTKQRTNKNVRENRRGNQEWTLQRHWLHWAHKTQEQYIKEKTDGEINNGHIRNIGNNGHTRHRTNKLKGKLKRQSRMDTSETLATFGKQDTGQKQTKHIWTTPVPKTNTHIVQRQNIDEQLKYMVAHFLGLVQALQ